MSSTRVRKQREPSPRRARSTEVDVQSGNPESYTTDRRCSGSRSNILADEFSSGFCPRPILQFADGNFYRTVLPINESVVSGLAFDGLIRAGTARHYHPGLTHSETAAFGRLCRVTHSRRSHA